MSTVAASTLTGRPSVSPAAQRARSDRWFFGGVSLLQIAVIVWGFAPTYFLRGAEMPALSPLLRLHGGLFTAWLVLLLVQTSLVAAKRTPLHRRLGVAGGVLIVAMVIVGYLAGIDAARRGSALPGMTPLGFLIIPVLSILSFGVLAGAALLLRRRPDVHKRLMFLATAGALLGPGLGRIQALASLGPLGFLGIPDLFVLALIGYDVVSTGRVHRVSAIGLVFIVAIQAIQLTAANSAAWLAVAGFLVG